MDLGDLRAALDRARDGIAASRDVGREVGERFRLLLDAARPGSEDPIVSILVGDELTETVRHTGWSCLVLNPGSTSTKVALYSGLRLIAADEVHLDPGQPDGVEERARHITSWLGRQGVSLQDLTGIAARGGFVAPVPAGTYRICEEMSADLERAPYRHASNLAVPMAIKLGERIGPDVELTITDPVTCDEVAPEHRVTGSSRIRTNGAAVHYLNLRAVFSVAAHLLQAPIADVHVVGCHMGGGMSAARCLAGRMAQVVLAFGNLPSANRSGALPLKEVLRLMEQHEYGVDDLRSDVVESGGGLLALTGTNDFRALLRFREASASPEQREKIDIVLRFYAGRIAAGILELCACEQPLDLLLLTGGMARDESFCASIAERLPLALPVVRVPGSIEGQALAAGLLRTCAHPRSLTPYRVARDRLADLRAREDRLLAEPVFPRKLLRRKEGSPLTSTDDIVAASQRGSGLLTVALAGADNVEAMLAARLANQQGALRLARFVLLGSYGQVSQLAWELDVPVDNDNFIIVDATQPAQQAVALLEAGVVDTIMKGSVTTAALLKEYLRYLKARGAMRKGGLLSHICIMDIPGRKKLVALTDPAINPSPDVEARAQILNNAVDVLHAIGIQRPKVAVISATEKASDRVVSSVEGREIASRFSDRDDLVVEGPISVDIALSATSAAEKGYEGQIRGDADLLLAPNIDVANAVYKSFTVGHGATVAGAVIGGDVPLVLTSRGDTARSKLASIALAIVLTHRARSRARA